MRSNLSDGAFSFRQHLGRLRKTRIADEVTGGLIGKLFKLTMQMYTADANLGSKHLDSKVRIGNVGVKRFHYSIHQPAVEGIHFHLSQLVIMSLLSGESIAQHPAALYKIQDTGLEHIYGERLDHIGVRTCFESGDAVFIGGLGSKKDNRDMIDIDITPYPLAKPDTIHYRHRNIAHDNVRSFLEYRVKRLLSIAALTHMKIRREFSGYKIPDFGVIIDKKDPDSGLRGQWLLLVRSLHVRYDRRYFHMRLQLIYILIFRKDVFVFYVLTSKRKSDNKAASLPFRILFRMDFSMVQFNKRAGQIQADTGTALIQSLRTAYLIEAVKDLFQFIRSDTDTVVGHGNPGIAAHLFKNQTDFTVFRRVFIGVGKKVIQHLVKIGLVYIHI